MPTKINMAQIKKKIAYSKPVLDATEKVAQKIVKDVTTAAEYSFITNPISQEIKEGQFADNSSKLLGGYGNLFSFIGFPRGDDPIGKVFAGWTQVSFKGLSRVFFRGRRVEYSYKVAIPSPEDFEELSEIPWAAGRSWLKGISIGISNFGYYLAGRGLGRSTGGKQEEHKLRNAQMKTDPYFTRIYNTFSKTFKPWIKF